MAEKKKELTIDEKLDVLISDLNKNFGIGTIINKNNMPKVARFSSGSPSLDRALGDGGWAKDRILEIIGNESSGKTTLALQAIAEVQKDGGKAAFVDAEHALDFTYARTLGVKTDELLITQPFCGEDCLEIVDAMCTSGLLDIIVIDSVAALVPRKELEGEMGDSHMGLQARLMSQALRKLTGIASKNGTTLIFINQWRSKIGLFGGQTTTGGNALKFYASQRVTLYRDSKPIMKEGVPVGIETKATVIKNKVSPPFLEASLMIKWGQGVDKFTDILRLSVEIDVIEKKGSWYRYLDGDSIQGEDNMAKFIKENNLYDELFAKLKAF
jgi:recombination protein RecA